MEPWGTRRNSGNGRIKKKHQGVLQIKYKINQNKIIFVNERKDLAENYHNRGSQFQQSCAFKSNKDSLHR